MGVWRVLYRCGRIIGHFTVHGMVEHILPGSPNVTVGVSCELLKSWYTNGKVHGRWHGTSPRDNERTIALYGQKHSEPTRGSPRG